MSSETTTKPSPSIYFCATRKDFETFCAERGINPRYQAVYIDRDEKTLGLEAHTLEKVVCFGQDVSIHALKRRGFE